MLVSNQLFFFLKVCNNLSKTLLEYLNLILVLIDSLCLIGRPLLVLLIHALVDGDVSHNLLVCILLLFDFSLLLLKLVTL